VRNVLQEAPLSDEQLLHAVSHLIESSADVADAVVAPREDSCRQIAYPKTSYGFRELIQRRGKLNREPQQRIVIAPKRSR